MLNFFKNTYKYNRFANNLLVDFISKNREQAPEKALSLMAHICNAQEIWLKRIKRTLGNSDNVWQEIPLEQLKQRLEQNQEDWEYFVHSLSPNDLERMIFYKNSKGDSFHNQINEILFHVLNHATHHRAQVSSLLRQSGLTPPVTDYIFYKRGQQDHL